MRNIKTQNSKGSVEGMLKKGFRFKKVPYDEDKYYLETFVKCKEFKLVITIDNLDLMTIYIKPKQQFLENPELLILSKEKYNLNRIKSLISRYKLLK